MGDSGGAPAATDRWPADALPGSQAAVQRGCLCSVLANAAYRTGASDLPLIEADCPLHAQQPGASA